MNEVKFFFFFLDKMNEVKFTCFNPCHFYVSHEIDSPSFSTMSFGHSLHTLFSSTLVNKLLTNNKLNAMGCCIIW
jgi:hypothetical protein